MENLAKKLDLSAFLEKFMSYFARPKSFELVGDRQFYAGLIKEIDNIFESIKPLPKLPSFENIILHLSKYGTVGIKEIFMLLLPVRYFCDLKVRLENIDNAPKCRAYLDKIVFPQAILDILLFFDEAGELKSGLEGEIFSQIDDIKQQIQSTQKRVESTLKNILQNERIKSYLVDNSLHLINQNECLLLRAGYHNAIKGMVLERSSGGFFYLLPEEIITLKERENALKDKLHQILYELCKSLSITLNKHLAFLKFINHAFDVFDNIYARLAFARDKNLEFIYELHANKDIVINEFCHPALHNPKPLSIAQKGSVLLITGVNAGGKTMLLKSILTACFLSKYLIPFKINPHKSRIPRFKHIVAIIADPQNSANDISTFAGRMLEFKQILHTKDMLLGIDEIELGTDADESASLYKVLLEHLMQNGAKIALTTHHKHLAAALANNPQVQLCAAMYDIEAQKPLFSFLDGSIGKSYAFETALMYGIPSFIINAAKSFYGEDKARLNELITHRMELELDLERKRSQLEALEQDYENKILALQNKENEQNRAFEALKQNLQRDYQKAINELKTALKATESKEIHKALNAANTALEIARGHQFTTNKRENALKVGDRVAYQNISGVICEINGQMCAIESDSGFKLRVKMSQVSKKPQIPNTPQKAHFKANSVSVKLDLHGKRGEEAIEELDIFLSNALIAGYDEVLISHGIGTGVLARLVKEFLQNHPKVITFTDAPAEMGGFGAKIVKL